MNPRIPDQKEKLLKLCGTKKCFGLEENTTVQNTQIDHVLVDKEMLKHIFATAFHNFASDHRPIVVRFGQSDCEFSQEFLAKIHFNSHHHLKSRKTKERVDYTRMFDNTTNDESTRDPSPSCENLDFENNTDLLMKSFHNPPGSNLCFSNAAVSCLLNIPKLRTFLLLNIDNSSDQNSIARELTSLAEQSTRTHDNSTHKIRVIVRSKCLEDGQSEKNFSDNRQHDSGEFIHFLFKHLWNEVPSLKDQVFGGLFQETLECECQEIVELPVHEIPEIIPVHFIGQNIQTCLDDFLAISEISWKCPKCIRTKVKKRTSVIIEPFTLMLQLLRYKIDERNQTIGKRHGKIFAPPQITFSSGTSYTLKSIINHIGENTQEGHYATLLHDESNKAFHRLDDSKVCYGVELEAEDSEQSYIFTYSK